jgi:Raf kinase inhibitor-like YbhB/YbcL family protein
MELQSPAFEHHGSIPRKYTCQGEDVNPPLEINAIPAGTKSLVLIVEDPDVPRNIRKDGLWVHWVVFNINPKTSQIPEHTSRFAKMGKNTDGKNAYQGPCPPDREHRYFFKVYALDTTLDLPEGASREEVLSAMKGHIIDQAELMGRYEKS